MGRIRVVVVDDGSSDSLADRDAAFPLQDVEVVGSLRITPYPGATHLSAGAAETSGESGRRSFVREALEDPGGQPSAARGGAGQTPPGVCRACAADDRVDDQVHLTRAELDVLRLLAKGQRNKEIAGELYISVNTVKSHVASIFRKLRVKNRSQAVRYVFNQGVR